MTFRDDHDAVIARADALARDVARLTEERDQARRRVDELEAHLAPLEAELARRRARVGALRIRAAAHVAAHRPGAQVPPPRF